MSREGGLFGSEGAESPAPGAAGVSPALSDAASSTRGAGASPSAVTRAFDPGRLRTSVERARAAAGVGDAALVDEVVDIVAFSLPEGEAPRPPVVAPEDLGRRVERTLVELGQAEVAREYILARDRSARAREVLGQGRRSDGAIGADRLPTVEGQGGSRPFEAGRIAAGLVEEAGLGREQATAVAARVESFLRGAALPVVGGGLVRELVNHALLEAGLAGAVGRYGAVGVPRRDLTAALHGSRPVQLERPPGPSAWDDHASRDEFDQVAADALVERWALQDVLPPKAAEAHRRADLHLLAARAPHRVLSQSISADLLAGGADWSRSAVFRFVRRVGLAMRDAGRGLFVEDLAGLLAAVVEPGGASFERREAPVVDLLQSLGAVSEASGRSLGLVRFGGKRGIASGRLIRALARAISEGGATVQLHATLGEVEDAITAAPRGEVREQTRAGIEHLLGSGHLVPVWAPEGSRWVGPGCTRGRRERGALSAASAVAINLPRLARVAGPWREERFLQLSLERVAAAVEACGSVARFQAAAVQRQGEALASRKVHLLVPVGLHEALRILGDGVAKPDQGAQVLGVLRDAGARLGRMADVQVEVSGAFQGPAAGRFAGADAPGDGPTQARLFEDLPLPEAERVEAYGGVVRGLDGALAEHAEGAPRRARELATLLGTSPTGALFPDLRDGGGSGGPKFTGLGGEGRAGADLPETPRFELWRQFHAHRGAGPSPGSGEAGKSLF